MSRVRHGLPADPAAALAAPQWPSASAAGAAVAAGQAIPSMAPLIGGGVLAACASSALCRCRRQLAGQPEMWWAGPGRRRRRVALRHLLLLGRRRGRDDRLQSSSLGSRLSLLAALPMPMPLPMLCLDFII